MKVSLADWMSQLPPEKRDESITLLSIPGSHDSLSYTINKSSGASPDSAKFLQLLIKCFGKIVRPLFLKWCVTQDADIVQQLNLGIRYFDLRISIKKNDPRFYFVHGLYGGSIEGPLCQMQMFLQQHQDEAVILDFQHFYGLSASDHRRLIQILHSIFDFTTLPKDLSKVTLNWMKDVGIQVLIIYRDSEGDKEEGFWPRNKWPTPWPDTMSENYLVSFLEAKLEERPKKSGFVSQCVLTPTNMTVVKHCMSSLQKVCALRAASVSIPWLAKQGPNNVNVAIADYVNSNDGLFPSTVVKLNTALEEDDNGNTKTAWK